MDKAGQRKQRSLLSFRIETCREKHREPEGRKLATKRLLYGRFRILRRTMPTQQLRQVL